MKCSSCGSDLPDDARFCIECGVTLDKATTGPTVHLRAGERSPVSCAACGESNPGHAIFCVRCGQRMSGAATRLASPRRVNGDIGQGTPSLPAFRPHQPPVAGPQISGNVLSTAVLMIGLGLLFLGHLFWPGILVLLGIVNFVRMSASGYTLQGVRSAIWLFGLAFLFMVPHLFLPGMFVLIGLNALISGMIRNGRQWP